MKWEDIEALLDKKEKVVIGRDPICDIVIKDIYVSRRHFEISHADNHLYITDKSSTNGTFVNDRRISRKTAIRKGDRIVFGHQLLIVGGASKDLNAFHPVEMNYVEVKINDKVLLHPFHLEVKKGEMLAIMGPSGCGKSTLLKTMMNIIHPHSGNVRILGLNIKENRHFLADKIAYVPQQDVVHKNLTVYDTLYYTCQLRLKNSLKEEEKHQRIEHALASVGLNNPHIKQNKVKNLSGGQIKRLCIASALITDPEIILLDEPTSPLDPETISEFMMYLNSMKQNGKTIVLVTHKPDDLKYCDSVLFMGSGGYPVFFGKPDELTESFNKKHINDVYHEFSDTSRSLRQYKHSFNLNPVFSSENKEPVNAGKKGLQYYAEQWQTFIKQWYWLCLRYAKINLSSREFLTIKFFQPILLAILIGFTFEKMTVAVIFIIVVSLLWLGISGSAREIIDEIHIFSYEKLYGLNIHSYILSKIVNLLVFAFVETLLLLFVLNNFYENDVIHLKSPINLSASLMVVSLASIMLGLMISSLFTQPEKVMSVLPLTLIPQLLFTGVIVPLDSHFKQNISFLTISRWGTELFCRYQQLSYNNEIQNTVLYNPSYDTTFKYIQPCINLPCMYGNQVRIKIPMNITTMYQSHIETKKANILTATPKITKDTLTVSGTDTIPKISNVKEYKLSDVFEEVDFYNEYHPGTSVTNSKFFNQMILIVFAIFFYIVIFYQLKYKR